MELAEMKKFSHDLIKRILDDSFGADRDQFRDEIPHDASIHHGFHREPFGLVERRHGGGIQAREQVNYLLHFILGDIHLQSHQLLAP